MDGSLRLRRAAKHASVSWRSAILDCYWVGSLDFSWLGLKGLFHKTHKRLNFLQRGRQQPRILVVCAECLSELLSILDGSVRVLTLKHSARR